MYNSILDIIPTIVGKTPDARSQAKRNPDETYLIGKINFILRDYTYFTCCTCSSTKIGIRLNRRKSCTVANTSFSQ